MPGSKIFSVIPKPRYISTDKNGSASSLPPFARDKTSANIAYDILTEGKLEYKCVGLSEWESSFGGIPEDFNPRGGYALEVAKDIITIGADHDEGRINAVHTLSQLLLQPKNGGIPPTRVIDWPAFETRCAHICYHLAMDRMPESVPSFDSLVETTKKLANFKYNAILLEIESMFPYRANHRISSPDAFSIEQIKELKRLCAVLGVEIIPLLQCLGHAYHVLRLPEYSHLREVPDTTQQYCPSNDEARKLYLTLAKELISAFSPARFHVGGDESKMLGICPTCRGKAAREGLGSLYGKHVGETARQISGLGPAPLVWSDMIEKYPSALSYLPGEAELVHWKYSLSKHGKGIDFRSFGRRKIWAAAGVRFGRCNHTMYRCHESMQGISLLAGEARREGCSNWIVTDWMKAIPYELSFFGQAFAAEESWDGGRTVEAFSEAYTEIVFGEREKNWHKAYESLEPILPYCEDAEIRQSDRIDRYDLSGLTFRERIAQFTITDNRTRAREDIRSGIEGARRALDIISDLEKRGIKRNTHEFEVLKLSALTHSHKARLGAAIDEAVVFLKYPSPGDEKKHRELITKFEFLIAEHEGLRSETEEKFAGKIPESHLQSFLNVKFEPAALKWMNYFKEALSRHDYLPSILNAQMEE